MAFKLTAKTRSILNQIQKNPSVVLDVEGLDIIYSSSVVFKRVTWDDNQEWDSGASWDSSSPSDEFISYINLKESTSIITQSIYPDKDGASSITSVQISIVDKNGSVSKKFAKNNIGEILGKKVGFSLGFVGANYPDDFMPIMNGVIVDYYYHAGSVNLTISHADSLRKQAVLTSSTTILTSPITNSDLEVEIENTSELLTPDEGFNTFIKIDDEIMKVEFIFPEKVSISERGALGTEAVEHDDGEVKFVYTLEGHPLELAQRIMMSSSGTFNWFDSDYIVTAFNVSGTENINNGLIVNHPDIQSATGLIVGDFLRLYFDSSYHEYTVLSFGVIEGGTSYIQIEENIDNATDLELNLSFRSKYNTLQWGLGMQPFEVDNIQIEEIKSTFAPNFTDMFFYIEDGIENARDFINKQLYFVSGCYGIPRNARTSVKFLSPPLSSDVLPILNENTIINLIDLKPTRSVNKFYYNDILFKYRKSILDGEYKTFKEYINSDSFNEFNVGIRQLPIESDGFQDNTQTTIVLNRLASRFLDRYKQAAIYVKDVKLPFKYGFNIQVGDIVLFGGSGVKLANYDTGDREIPIEKYEVINQKIDLSGIISLDILSTGYSVSGVFASFSPSSLVDSATTTKIKVKKINNADGFDFERDKYNELVGVKFRIRSEDFSYDETTTLLKLDEQDRNTLVVDDLPFPPSSGYIIELALYDDQDNYGTSDNVDAMKQRYSFTMPQTTVTSGASNTVFDVESVGDLFVGCNISVHSDDFDKIKEVTKIIDITGLTVTVDDQLGFTPLADYKVETLTNKDGLDGYLFL